MIGLGLQRHLRILQAAVIGHAVVTPTFNITARHGGVCAQRMRVHCANAG